MPFALNGMRPSMRPWTMRCPPAAGRSRNGPRREAGPAPRSPAHGGGPGSARGSVGNVCPGARLGVVFTVHATKKLLDRVTQRRRPEVATPTSMMGNWYATFVGWRPQVALFVNEQTLLPVLTPLAPAATLLSRFPEHLAGSLRALGVPSEFVESELQAMGEGVWAKTANRSLVGSMTEFVLLANAWRARGRDDLLALSLHLAEVPCSPLYRAEVSPDRAVAALVERWRAGTLAVPVPAPVALAPPEPPAEPPARPDPHAVRNQRRASDIDDGEVGRAIDRIAVRSDERARDARHIYDSLTWGEGASQITQAAVQNWLWYQLPTKYLTDEPGYQSRLAGIAAELFDELGLDLYAAVCRSARTGEVHDAFDRSPEQGYSAMRRAVEASGIDPPDTDSFRWGGVMGIEEACAHSAVEVALERAMSDGEFGVGDRGWRSRQQLVTERTLDRRHPSQPGQSWRTAIATERVANWISDAARRSGELGRMRARVGNQMLHPIVPPPDVAERMAPIMWLLQRFGSEQALTQAGYLNRPFVLAIHTERPWNDPFDAGPPRSETDEITLHRLRGFLEHAGALRKRSHVLHRTKRGTAMAVDPIVAWGAVVEHLGADAWSRFVTETAGLVLVDRGEPVLERELTRLVVAFAGEAGWRSGGDPPNGRAVLAAFSDSRALMDLCGLLSEEGDWSARRYRLTSSGVTLVRALLRQTAAGPRNHP